MLEANESDSSSIDYKLPRVSSPDSYHQYDVDLGVHVQKCSALLLGVTGQGDYVHSLEHCSKITASSKGRSPGNIGEVWSVRIENVICPVCLKDISVGVEVAVIGRDAIGAVKNCEEIRQQVNQHQRPGRE